MTPMKVRQFQWHPGNWHGTGIFMQYGVTIDDDATEVRNGGFGSTTK